MGLFRDVFSKGIEFVREDIVPLRYDLMKAGILSPDKGAYEPKSNLTDPTNYGTMNYGYKEKWALIDYSKCRQISYSDPIVAAIQQVRINQAAAFSIAQSDKFKPGFKIVLKDKEKEITDAEKKRAREIEEFIVYTGVPENFEDTPEIKRRDNFETFLRKIARDSMTFDQINFEITPRRDGTPYAFQAIDASTIRLVPDKKEKQEWFSGDRGYETKDYMNVMPAGGNSAMEGQFEPKHPKYAQVVNGMVRHIYDEWEMAFGVRNPRTDILSQGYGFSEIEMMITTITSHMNAEAYNRRFFSQGSTVKGILTFEGAVPPDQLEAFRRQWYMQSTGITNAWKTPIMSLGEKNKLAWTDLHKSNSEMEYGKWLEYCIKTICGVYQIDPIEIGFDISKQSSGSGGGGGGLGQGSQREKILFSQEKGLRPLLRHIQGLINDYIVYRIDPAFQFEFVGLNVKSEDDELKMATEQVKAYKTVNEVRAENDLEPIPEMDKIKSLGDIILDPGWIQAFSGAQAMAEEGAPGEGEDGAVNGEMAAPEEEGGEEEEPDYENMSVDELNAELGKLQGGGADKPDAKPSAGGEAPPKEKFAPKKEPAEQKAPPIKKSVELEL